MNLFVCKNRTEEYSCGMIIAAAEDIEQAKEVIKTSQYHQPGWEYSWDLNCVREMEGSTTIKSPHIVEEIYYNG